MPDIGQEIASRISNAARAVAIARSRVEQARNYEERLMLEKDLERAETEMQEAAMLVNRGISRVPPA